MVGLFVFMLFQEQVVSKWRKWLVYSELTDSHKITTSPVIAKWSTRSRGFQGVAGYHGCGDPIVLLAEKLSTFVSDALCRIQYWVYRGTYFSFVRAKEKFVVVPIRGVRCFDKGEVLIRSGVWSTYTKHCTLLLALVG